MKLLSRLALAALLAPLAVVAPIEHYLGRVDIGAFHGLL